MGVSIHKVINGLGQAVSWAVVKDKSRVLAEFDDLVEACNYADEVVVDGVWIVTD